MTRVKITADAALAIIRGIFEDEEIDVAVSDSSAPPSWQGQTVSEILNVEYYTFKTRPVSSIDIIRKRLEETGTANRLEALNRAFCLCSLGKVERVYTKDVDQSVFSVTLEYFLQTSKLKLLEYLAEEASVKTCGLRIPVQFGDETRKAVLFFGKPYVSDIVSASPFGECSVVEIDVTVALFPDVVTYGDYTVTITFENDDGESVTADVPLSSFSIANTMTQEAMPHMNNPRNVGNINLSRGNSFVLVFDGYVNAFIDYISDKALNSDAEQDNNQAYILTIQRGEKTYTHTVIIKDHQVTVNADTGNETHTLTFTKRGINDGAA